MAKRTGDKIAEAGVQAGGFWKNLWTSLSIIAGTVVIWYPDVFLGAEFMTDYAEHSNTPLPSMVIFSIPLSTLIPWMISVSTSGIQYLIYRRFRKGIKNNNSYDRWALILAIIMSFVDTALDVAGLTAWMYGAEQGINLIPNPITGLWILVLPFVLFVCLFQEFLFVSLVIPYAGKARESALGSAGGWMVDKTVWLIDVAFGINRAGAVTLCTVAIMSLDLILGPELIFTFTDDPAVTAARWQVLIIPWAISFFLSFVQFAIFRKIRSGSASRLYKIVGITFVIIDTCADLAGFTAFVHGTDIHYIIMPWDIGLTWVLLLLLVGPLCAVGEWVLAVLLGDNDEDNEAGGDDPDEEVSFRRPKREKRVKQPKSPPSGPIARPPSSGSSSPPPGFMSGGGFAPCLAV